MFATTHWSVVLAAGGVDSPHAREALEKLCNAYWYPVYASVRRWGHTADEAQDLTQSFFASFLQRGSVSAARPERGKFRWFLLSALKHFLADEWDRVKAQKRGGGAVPISLDRAAAENRYSMEPAHDITPERLFERSWGITVLERVRSRLREEFRQQNKSEQFDLLDQLLPGSNGELTVADVAKRLGVAESTVRSDVHRFKRRLGELLRAEIAHTVADPSEIDGEINHLMEVLSG
ncbi:MAG: sigma-70 family RNA polymerase sigma factor [Verrucomicrobiae bacterium]|nr:sigma-70 family RNA polymerase sigma factor [Verrucomicrobiae bacterium]